VETQQLEALLALRRETQTFEVKGCASFSVEFLAKDILAMANHRDGGHIVIGIEDETFARQGVDQETINTYKVDVMRDKMAKFATPAIRFDVDVVTGQDGLRFVVIDVATFDRVPVVCRNNNNKDVYPGMIYYRGSQGRVRSEAISNADDMLDLAWIFRAVSDDGLMWLRCAAG
jgi:predicted HTH transcriptional regulator